MNLQDLSTHVLNFLRDPIWQSMGVFVAILIALISASRDSTSPLSLSTIKRTFWAITIPLLAAAGIVAILWRQIEVAIIINMLVITVYLVKERENSNENIKNGNSGEVKPKKALLPSDNPRYIKPPKR